MFNKIKSFLKKEETFSCIVWDGKTMSYPSLTKKQIEEIENNPNKKEWKVMLKREEP